MHGACYEHDDFEIHIRVWFVLVLGSNGLRIWYR